MTKDVKTKIDWMHRAIGHAPQLAGGQEMVSYGNTELSNRVSHL